MIVDVLLLGGISWLGCVGRDNRCTFITFIGWNKFVELCWLC